MSDLLKELRDTPLLWLKSLVVVVSIAFLVALFPREVKFQYEFQKGMPWLHEKLIAPFDFAIYKTEEELKAEEQEIRVQHSPYFYFADSLTEWMIHDFEVAYVASWDSLNYNEEEGFPEFTHREELDFGLNILREIYTSGIIESHESIQGKGRDFIINVSRNEYTEQKELLDVYKISDALDYIDIQLIRKSQLNKRFLTDLLRAHLQPNLFFDATRSDLVLKEKLTNISLTFGKVSKDLKIVDKGEMVNDDLYKKLLSLKREYELRSNQTDSFILIIGQTLIVTSSLLVLLLFLTVFRKDVINENNRFFFIILVFNLTIFLAVMPQVFEDLNLFILPFCILPILIRTFFDTRLAIFTHVIACLVIGFLAPNGFEFVFVQTLTGIAAIFSLASLRKRSQLLTTVVIIFTVYAITYTGLSILHEGDLSRINWSKLQWFGVSSILTLLVYPLIFIFEKLFRFVSDVTLIELSDTNARLLRALNSRAPGTFQHSLQVANLGEAGALLIGADSLLVRTGALYHDIGKMNDPRYFIENQVAGQNPHDELSNHESAEIIIRHVTDGVVMARKHNLPEKIIDFIQTHHGTTTTRYFYYQEVKDKGMENVNVGDFQYPGPIPFSKETAILMMADSVEAASRSLQDYSEANVDRLVDAVVDNQAGEDQFVNSDITFKDLSALKELFKKMLKGIYHVRVEYPEKELEDV